jgi:hypothetical protein
VKVDPTGRDMISEAQLEAFLKKRLAQFDAGEVSQRTVSEIFQAAIEAAKPSRDA